MARPKGTFPSENFRLHHLILFLNAKITKANQSNFFGGFAQSVDELKELQSELQQDLGNIFDPPPIPADMPLDEEHWFVAQIPHSPTGFWLWTLVKKIESMKSFSTVRSVTRYVARSRKEDLRKILKELESKPDLFFGSMASVVSADNALFSVESFVDKPPSRKGPGRYAVRINGENFLITDHPESEDVRAEGYLLVYELLRSGEFSLLRRCLVCSKYFAARRANKQCCSRDCNVKYQNRRRADEDYFNIQRAKKRKSKKKKLAARA